MKLMNLTALICLGVAAFAQEVQFDYNRSANFQRLQNIPMDRLQTSAAR